VKNVLPERRAQHRAECVACHQVVPTPLPTTTPPIWYTNFDRDGNGTIDATDDAWFVKALQGR